MQKWVATRRKKIVNSIICWYNQQISSILVPNNSTKLSKKLINGTFLCLLHLSKSGSKLKDTLLHVLRTATPSTSSSSSARPWYMTQPFLNILHRFYIPEVSVKWIIMGDVGDVSSHSSFPMNFFALNSLTFLSWVIHNFLFELTLSSILVVETNFCIQRLEKSFQNKYITACCNV